GNANQCNGSCPLLQEVVPTPRPTKLPLLPPCSTEGRSPTITSGPGTVPTEGWAACSPALAARSRGGIVTDCRAPLTTVAISTGCMLVPIEIFPATKPAPEGCPSAWANSCEIRSFPSVMLSNCALAS